MKIAILISGHLRSFRSTYASFQKSFDNLRPDVFCHTWSKMGHGDAVWWSGTGDSNQDPVTEEVQNEMRGYYRPKALQVDEQIIYPPPSGYEDRSGFTAVKNQFLGLQRANQLRQEYSKQNGITYDVVIRSRYDLSYRQAPPYNEFRGVHSNLFVLPTPGSRQAGTVSETFFFSSQANMDRICDFNNEIEKYALHALEVHPYFEGEIPFKRYLCDLGFSSKIHYSHAKVLLLRMGGGIYTLWGG